MKKIIAIILAALLMIPFAAFGGSAEDVQRASEYYGTLLGHFDTILVDDEIVGTDGQALQYLLDNNGLLEVDGAKNLTLRGWLACDVEIEAFGYQIDEGEPVFKDQFKQTAEDAVFKVGEQHGAEYASRFRIDIDVSDLKGMKHITLLVKNEDGIFVFLTDTSVELEFDFLQKGTETAADPTPKPETSDVPEAILIRFNDYNITEDFFMYASAHNKVSDIYYDEDRNCCIIKTTGGDDPNALLPFSQIPLDPGLGILDGYINTEDYKSIVIIGRFDYDSVYDSDKAVTGTFYYTTDESQGFSEMKNLKYTYEKTDGLQYIVLDLAKQKSYWKGFVDDCRFDFFTSTDNECEYEFYFIGFFADKALADAFVENYKANGDSVFPEITPDPTKEPAETPSANVSETEAPDPAGAPADTGEPVATDGNSKADEKKSGSGCGAAVSALCALMIPLTGFVVIKRKEIKL